MKKKLIISVLVAVTMGMATGCGGESDTIEPIATEQQSVETQVSESDKAETVSFDVNWDQCRDDLVSELVSDDYPYIQDVYLGVDDETRRITLTATLDDATAPDVALDLADTMIRRTCALANMQDSDVTMPGADTYGGLFDVYDCMIGIAPMSQVNNSDQWFVYDAIARGTNQKPELTAAYRS
ncbi:hypothetical protein [Butyricicoccus pullicaecorum]|uniref:Lipoprotein n=1 Tax=Butyricicoccus pullicaecorum 1.2 TaxID=1203606 RepID=R8VZY7_9FIRM|nr:hypothetical protein [Butyricicoccus pullicaecorum]EOQ38285.1 hypothetical protein HMPREF1526_01315 [Butyricicoccus pullicaecorum 1.2]SKA54377.1 hypothetical protein SAMN02745978_00538 [Butyricicoccus pullicaecorum DSM 23266]